MNYHGLTLIKVSKNKRLVHGFFGLVCILSIVSRLSGVYLEGDENTVDLKNIWKFILGKGIKIGYSSGKAFNPAEQERTSAMDDFLHPRKKKKKEKEKWD